MAYREVSMVEVKEVLRLWLRGRAIKTINRKQGIARNTVRSYIKAAEKCGLKQRMGESALTEELLTQVLLQLKGKPQKAHGESWELCEENREFIKKKLDAKLRLTKTRKLLLRKGVQIPYSTLHRFAVAELEFGRQAPTIPVADCDPGQEVQVDTGWMGLLEPDRFTGKRRRYRAWIFTAVRSRHRFVYPTFRERTDDAIEACEAAWEYFGGIFEVLIPDNTKAIVVKADPLDPVINETFLEYAQARGFEVDPARVRHPKDKARVERAVPSTRDDCFAGEELYSIGDARRRAQYWSVQEYGMRRHSRTQRLPLEHFEAEEKGSLKPPPSEPYDIPLWCDPKVHKDQHVQVAKALYSVPRYFEGTPLIGKYLRARADSRIVRIYYSQLLVKTHDRKPPGGRSTDPSDFPPDKAAYANRDLDFLKKQANKHGDAVGAFAEGVLEGPLPWTRMRRVYALLGLCKRFGSDRVEQACTVALKAEMLDVHRLERMIKLDLVPKPKPPTAKVIPMSRYLRPATQYALPFPTHSPDNTEETHDD
jgi:transposase